jgi:hypothetical protein
MKSKWAIFKPHVVRRGNLSGTVQPETEWVQSTYWGEFDSRNEAKAAWAREMDPDLADCENIELLVRHFDAQYRNLKLAKVMRI